MRTAIATAEVADEQDGSGGVGWRWARGLERVPEALNLLFTGGSAGNLMVTV
jgi:hypothetical protein